MPRVKVSARKTIAVLAGPAVLGLGLLVCLGSAPALAQVQVQATDEAESSSGAAEPGLDGPDAPASALPSASASASTSAPASASASAPTTPVPTCSVTAPIEELLPELKPATEALAEGRFKRARELFENFITSHADAPLAGAVKVLRAACDARLGQWDAADAAYREAETAVPELRDFLRGERARLALREGRFDDADAHIEALTMGHREFFSLLFERAQRELRAAKKDGALSTLGRLLPASVLTWERATAARLMADARFALSGDRAAWRGHLADLWRAWPKSDAARAAESVLLAATGDLAVTEAALTLDELVELAARRAEGGGPKAAEPVVQALERRWPKRLAGLDALLGALPQIKTRTVVARVALDGALVVVTEPVIRDRLWEARARTLRQSERYDDALAVYRTIGRDGGSSLRRAVALVEGGRMARRMGRFSESRWFFDRFLARHQELPEARAEALWALGWYAWREGRLDEADRFLTLVQTETPDTTDSSARTYAERATYWRARILQRRGHRDAALALFAEVETRWPLSYYANLSAAWRRRAGADDALPKPGPEEPKSAPVWTAIQEVDPPAVPALTLSRLGLKDEARALLRHVHRQGRLGIPGVQLLSALYRAEGNESLAHWVVQGADPLRAPPIKDARGRWLSAFPRPFADIVEKEGKEHGVDPLLIWAVMRQESGFRTTARSGAKAHGLMQVLLPTARHVARKLLGEKQPSLAKVYTPQANVHYGTAYLRHLLDRYQGNPALAFAGYNAGPGAVDKWLKRFGPLDCDEFVEEIPYAEAQGYARKVIRSYAAYTYLYGRSDSPFLELPLKLPTKRGPVAMLR